MAADVWMYGHMYGQYTFQVGLSFQAIASLHIFVKVTKTQNLLANLTGNI